MFFLITDACEPGSFSSDGIVPCSLCEVGYYQNKYGQTVCIRCPGAQSTVSIGSADISNCNGNIFGLHFLVLFSMTYHCYLQS